MRSLGAVALGLVCVALFVFAIKNVLSTAQRWESWELDTTRLFTALEVERIVRDSNAVMLARLDSVSRVGRLAATRSRMRGDSLRGVAESLVGVVRASQDSLVPRQEALRAIETLEGSLGEARNENTALEAIIASQSQMLGVAKLENDRLWTLIDSASSVIRRVPKACRVPLLGLPCPVPTVGVGLTADGIRAYVGVGFPLRQH